MKYVNMNEQSDKFSHHEKMDELLDKKQQLERRVRDIEKDIKSGLDPDSEEQAVQLENYEVLLGLLKSAEDELNSINKQIFQLENANY